MPTDVQTPFLGTPLGPPVSWKIRTNNKYYYCYYYYVYYCYYYYYYYYHYGSSRSTNTDSEPRDRTLKALQSVSILRFSKLRLLDSYFPGNPLWAWESPLKIKILLESSPLTSKILVRRLAIPPRLQMLATLDDNCLKMEEVAKSKITQTNK